MTDMETVYYDLTASSVWWIFEILECTEDIKKSFCQIDYVGIRYFGQCFRFDVGEYRRYVVFTIPDEDTGKDKEVKIDCTELYFSKCKLYIQSDGYMSLLLCDKGGNINLCTVSESVKRWITANMTQITND